MIDKNCLPKEIHCVYGFITEENFASKTHKCKLLNKLYLGLVRCGVEEDIFDCMNIVLELYHLFAGSYQAHKVHSLYRNFVGSYEHRKNDIFAALYYLLRRTNKDSMLLEIIESKFEPDFPFGAGTSLDVFRRIVEDEECEHEDFLSTQDYYFQEYGKWQEDDWWDMIKEFEDIVSQYTFERTEVQHLKATMEAMDNRYKELEEYYNSPEGQAELEALADDPTFEEIENAPCVPDDEILVWDNKGLKSLKKENIIKSQSSADFSSFFTSEMTSDDWAPLQNAWQSDGNGAGLTVQLMQDLYRQGKVKKDLKQKPFFDMMNCRFGTKFTKQNFNAAIRLYDVCNVFRLRNK